MIFFSSDQHYFHKNIILYSKRPYSSVEEMNKALIDNWNKQVSPNDIVYNLGDFAFCQYPQLIDILEKLNGTKHLILGNHDKMIIQNRKELLEKKYFASINNYVELKSDKHPLICLFHYGQRVWNKSHHGSIMLYGHSHGTLPPYGKSVDVGVDCKEITNEYRPVSLNEVLAYMNKREYIKVDHHGE